MGMRLIWRAKWTGNEADLVRWSGNEADLENEVNMDRRWKGRRGGWNVRGYPMHWDEVTSWKQVGY